MAKFFGVTVSDINSVSRPSSSYGAKISQVSGTKRADNLDGGYGTQKIFGNEGNDTLWGGINSKAPDHLYGGADNDILFGEGGGDFLYGESGNDILWGGSEIDTLDGGSGDDVLAGESGIDYLYGGSGSDTLIGGGDTDYIHGDGTLSFTQQLFNNSDKIDGGAGIDFLHGEYGNDTIYGGSDNDFITDGFGSDTIIGGTGADDIYLEKNDGAKDTIVINKGDSGFYFNEMDFIYNFVSGLDKIDFSDFNIDMSDIFVKKESLSQAVVYVDQDGDDRADFAVSVESLNGQSLLWNSENYIF